MRQWRFSRVAATTLVLALVIGAAGVGHAWRKNAGLPGQYESLLSSADGLWAEYKQADRDFFDQGSSDLRSHANRLAGIQNRLANLHGQWMQTDAPEGLEAIDLKVGLALELQMAAVGAELVGLLDDDQSYLDLSAELDNEYSQVVDDL